MISSFNRILVQGKGYVHPFQIDKAEVWDGKQFVDCSISSDVGKTKLVTCENGNIFECDSKLTKGDKLVVTDNTPEFDFLDTSKFKYLQFLNSYEIGILVGANYLYGSDTLNLPSTESTLRKLVRGLLRDANVDYDENAKHLATKVIEVHSFSDKKFIAELRSFIKDGAFSEDVWTSKVFLAGFLMTLFNTASTANKSLTIKLKRGLAIDVQQALYLFSVRAKHVKGLNIDSLVINKVDIFNFCRVLGIHDFSRILYALSNDTLESFRVMSFRPLTLTVNSVSMKNEEIEMFDVSLDRVMLNGIILGK